MNLKIKTILQLSYGGRKVLRITKCILVIRIYTVRIFLLHIRRQFPQTGFIIVIVLLSAIRIVNDALHIPFTRAVTIIYLVNPFKLTPLCPDGVECTHLT